nr:cytochrome P450 [Nocardia sp. BMG111209]
MNASTWKHAARIARSGAAALTSRYPSAPRPLAEPPAGSGLLPVPGDGGVPYLGASLQLLDDPLRFFRGRERRYGPLFWCRALGREVVVVGDPAGMEQVLLDREKVFSAKGGWDFLIGAFFDGGILLRDFEEHLHHRRIMQQAFTRPRLIGYLDIINPAVTQRLSTWRPGDDFRLFDATKKMLLETATEVFVGADLAPGQADRLERAFIDAVRGGQALVRAPLPGGIWARGLRGRRVLQEFFRDQLPRKRSGDGADLFSVLCHSASVEGHTFTDADIVDHMIFVLMAAHDTSTIALSMLAYHLARDPQWQDRLRAESQALGTEHLGYPDLDRLPGLDLAFKETLRMYSPVSQQMREALRDTEINGHHVPAGTLVAASSYPMMRRSGPWPDPDRWDPSRFEADAASRHRFAWAPFGGGAHKCIGLYFGGMTVKSVLHQMLLRYRWSVPDGYEVPLEIATGPAPADGLPVRLERLPAPAGLQVG